MLKFSILIVVAAGVLGSIGSAQIGDKPEPTLSQETFWHGKNGKAIYGAFVKEEAGMILVYNWETKTTYKLREETLAPRTVEWYRRMKEKQDSPKPSKPAPTPTVESVPDGFQKIDGARLDRSEVPVVDQQKFGQKASDCVPNAYAAFFLWWGQHSNLPIPKGRDFDDKAEWIHKELARRFVTRNNTGTRYRELEKGLAEYFVRYFEGDARFTFHEDFDIRPSHIAELVKDGRCTVLTLTVYHGRRVNGGHAVSLLEAAADGRIRFNTWGHSFTGKIEPLEKLAERERVPNKAAPRERFEIKLDPTNDIPGWMKRDQVRFVLDPIRWDAVQVLTPYVKKK